MVSSSDFMFRLWLMDKCQFQIPSFTLGTTFAQLMPADPMRAAIIFGCNSNASVFFSFSDAMPTSGQGLISYATGQQPLVLTFDQIGLPMRLPVWGKASTTSTNVVLLTSSFDPHRYQQALRYMNDHLSQYGSP